MTVLDRLVVRGKTAQAELVDRVTTAKVSLSAALSPDDYAVSQLTLVVADPDRAVYNTHLFDRGASVSLGDLFCRVASHELRQPNSGTEVQVEARSFGAEYLRSQRGAQDWASITLANLARQLGEAAGLKVQAQDSGVLALQRFSRAGADPNVPGDKGESSWDLLVREGKAVGYVLFEAYSTLFFGKPTWLVSVLAVLTIDCRPGQLPGNVLALPTCRRSTDDRGRDVLTVTVRVTLALAMQMSPGMGLQLKGVERFGQKLIVSRVEYDAADGGAGEGTITGVLPTNPPTDLTGSTSLPADFSGQGATADGGTFGRFVNALVGQESGGSYSAVNSRTGALGRYQVLPGNVGPWSRQILGRTITTQQFKDNPVLQDQIAVGILWSSYQQHGARGAAAQWYSGRPEKANDYTPGKHKGEPSVGEYVDQVLNRMKTASSVLPPGYTGPGTPSTTATTGATGNAFATICQQQVDGGARYVLGAEASPSNPNPTAFDCSELVQWAAARLGVTVPDGSVNQWKFCQTKNTTMTIPRATQVRGALLFAIRPGRISHVAISMGDGLHTIEAANSKAGLINSNIAGRDWTGAGLVPGLSYGPVAVR